ncbi:hypothetical protein [Paraglaciecola sp.]|uniref:hypothetical protein n=1 Tax=Paraglaciecola sp. TaxID=1920173 RepID=UPI003EF6F2BA
MRKFLLLISLLFIPSLIQVKAQTQADLKQQNIYPLLYPGVKQSNLRSKYQIELLKHALSYSEHQFLVEANGQSIPTARNFKLLEQNEIVQILWSTSRNDRDEGYLAVQIPLLKGLLGLRIPLIHQQSENLFKQTMILKDLRSHSAGQLDAWSDAKILRHNGISVTNGVNFNALFKMLALKRFDYFPRSIAEIKNDLSRHKTLPLIIDKHIAIYYPTAMYFFVNKANKFLHTQVLNGLESAIKDGSFDKIFLEFHQKSLDELNLNKRKIIQLQNPLLPDSTPIHRKELWLKLF